MPRPHLASLVEDLRRIGRETAVVLHRGNRRFPASYGELAVLAARFAAELETRNVHPGERVVIWGDNSAEWIAAFFGCLLRGVIAVPLDAAGSPEFAAKVIADVAPRLIVGDRTRLDAITSDTLMLYFSAFSAALPAQPLWAVSDAVNMETPFQIVFTSGTTSEPKGIVHTHRNVLASLQPIEDEIVKYRKYERWVHPLRFLHTLPLSHVFGQFMGLWIPALLAAEIHLDTQLEPAHLIELGRRERISVLIAVPRVLELLRSHLLTKYPTLATEMEAAKGFKVWTRWWRFRRIHNALGWKFWAMICGGATLPADLEKFWSTLGIALIQGYGMTETAALVTLNHPMKIGRGTIGKPLPGREIKLGEDGEILVRGAMLSTASWQGGRMQMRESEWLATGDLAEQSHTGELRFTGRKGDVIVSAAGMNIYPADLEAAMLQQPGVRGCVVVPCETPAGIEPVAVLQFDGDNEQMRTAVASANLSLSEYQQIRRTLRWPEATFPYTSTGKLIRRRVRDWACTTLTGVAPANPESQTDLLLRWIAEVTHEQPERTDDYARLSEDLHLDSLGRVQLQSLIEQRVGAEINDDLMSGIETLGQLRLLTLRPMAPMTGSVVRYTVSGGIRTEPVKPQLDPEWLAESAPSDHTYPRWPWVWPVAWVRIAFLELIMRPLVWLLAAPKVVREGPLPDAPVLLISNHVTSYDGALVIYALPFKLRRRIAAAMSGEMLLDYRKRRKQGSWLLNQLAPAAYWLLTALFNVFPLPRLRGFRRSFAHAGEAMDRGYSVLIFPEGHRSKDGRLQVFRPGIGILAQDSHVSIVPIALKGLGELRDGTRGWFRSGALTIHVGRALSHDEDADAEAVAKQLHDIVAGL